MHTNKQSRPYFYRKTLLASALLSVLLVVAIPQIAAAQTSNAATQVKESMEGNRLFDAGGKAYQQGEMATAAQLWEQAITIYSKELGGDHTDTLDATDNLATTYFQLGWFKKSLVLQEKSLSLRRIMLGHEHPKTLFLMNLEAITYRKLGEYDKSLALHDESLQLRRNKLGEDHSDTLASMNNLALTYRALGQYDKELALYDKTLQLRRSKLGEDHPDTLQSMNNLASAYYGLGQYDKALALYDKTLQLRRSKLGEDHPDTLQSMNNLGATYSILGQYSKALALNEITFQLSRSKLGEENPETLAAMGNLAKSYRDLGLYDMGLAMAEKNLQLRRSKLGDEHSDTLSSMNDLALAYRSLGQRDKALALMEKTLQLRRNKLREDHPDTLASMNNLAALYSDLGQHDKALALNEKNLQLTRSELGEKHTLTMASMANLALSYRALGKNEMALNLNENVVQLRSSERGEINPDTLIAMQNLAMNYLSLGQNDKGFASIFAVITGAEKLRAMPGLSTEQQQSIFAKYSDDYQLYANWYSQARRPDDGFRTGDLSKARTLTDSIKAQSALRSLPENEQNRLQASQSRARLLLAQQDKRSTTSGDTAAILTRQKQIDAHNASHLQLVAELSSRYPKYAQMNSIPAADIKQARHLLSGNDAFVSYLIDTKGQAQVFVLDQSGTARWTDLGTINNHASSVAATRELLAPASAGSLVGQLLELKEGGYAWLPAAQAIPKDASVVASDRVAALSLLNRYWHDKLIKPVLTLAGNKSRWIISPDKDLALLPFDVLPETFNGTGEAGTTLTTLAQTRNLTLVQSFAVYALLKQREAAYATLQRPKELFAMGNAVYGDGWSENRGMTRGRGEPSFVARNASATEAATTATVAKLPMKPGSEQFAIEQLIWKNLPGTAREVNAVSAVFSNATSGVTKGAGVQQVDSYLGKDASEGKLQELNAAGKLKDYRYLLFSAHGYLAQNPALSSLVLSLQGNPPGIDGHVTASEWPLYDVRSDLTVLSACDTGVGKTQAGESVMGLPYALFVAGNKNTLLSLWPVDDEATAEFMRRFFSKLKAGSTQPNALTETKREFMQHPLWNAPKYWAAFVLYGV